MSTNIGAVGAEERRGALNFWILILVVAMVFLIAGGAHYVLDVVWGTGWLMKDITWF